MQIIHDYIQFSTDGAAGDVFKGYDFPEMVNGATAVLEGIEIQFQRDDGADVDRHLGHLKVVLATAIEGAGNSHVTVQGVFALRDYSGGSPGADDLNGDDPIKGTIWYSVFIV